MTERLSVVGEVEAELDVSQHGAHVLDWKLAVELVPLLLADQRAVTRVPLGEVTPLLAFTGLDRGHRVLVRALAHLHQLPELHQPTAVTSSGCTRGQPEAGLSLASPRCPA